MSKARFSDRLKTLDLLYRFAGGRGAPSEIETERPITLVHDVAPDAGRVATRWFLHVIGVTNAASTTVFTDLTKEDLLVAAAQNEPAVKTLGDVDVWLLDITLGITSASKANISGCYAVVTRPVEEGVTNSSPFLETAAQMVRHWNTAFGGLMYDSGAIEAMYADAEYPGLFARLPRRIGVLTLRTSAGAGGSALYRSQALFCITPKGVLPPALTGWT